MKNTILTGLICAMFSAMPTLAANVDAKIDVVDQRWTTLNNGIDGLVPVKWELPNHLPTGESLIPGSVLSNDVTNVVLSNGTEEISFPIKIKGIEYRIRELGEVRNNMLGRANTNITGSTVTVLGQGIGDQQIDFDSPTSMISMYRPIIEDISIQSIADLLDGRSKGTYSGFHNVVFKYEYYRNGVRIGHVVNLPIHINISYNPAHINEAKIIEGMDGKMTATYHGHPEIIVSGLGSYRVQVSGDFTSGLKASVYGAESRYAMKMLDGEVDETSEILYDVTCSENCTGNNVLISKGVPSSSHVDIDIGDGHQTNVKFDVSFNDKPYDELKKGKYAGMFRVIFEAEL